MKAAAAALIIAIGLYLFGHHNGWAERNAEMQAEIAAKNEQVRQTEHRLNEQLNVTSNELKKANDDIDQKTTALDRAIRAGRVRLPSSSCVQAAGGTTATSGNQQAGAESDIETLRLIAQIAADGDRAINQLNACITAYEQIREAANGQR